MIFGRVVIGVWVIIGEDFCFCFVEKCFKFGIFCCVKFVWGFGMDVVIFW